MCAIFPSAHVLTLLCHSCFARTLERTSHPPSTATRALGDTHTVLPRDVRWNRCALESWVLGLCQWWTAPPPGSRRPPSTAAEPLFLRCAWCVLHVTSARRKD